MTDFKISDRIRVVADILDDEGGLYAPQGMTGRVVVIFNDGEPGPIGVDPDHDPDLTYVFERDELEVIA